MNHRKLTAALVTIQLVNAFLLLVFSIYVAVVAYPLVAFLQERSTTISYVGNVAVFDVLGVLAFVGWRGLRREELWGWWLALSANAVIFGLLTLDSVALGLRETYFQPPAMALLAAAGVVLLLMPAVRKHYSGRNSKQVVDLW